MSDWTYAPQTNEKFKSNNDVMKDKKTNIKNPTSVFVQAVSDRLQEKYVMRLYITGASRRSNLALTNIKEICGEYLEGGYELEVIDLFQYPALAKEAQIIAAPTLIKRFPLPFRRIIGDMSNREKVISGLDLRLPNAKKDSP